MASTTDNLPVESGTGTRETTRPPKARRGALTWAAVIGACVAVAALAVAAFTGGEDNTDIPATRLDPQAEVYERQAHLEGQARTYGGVSGVGATAASQTANQTAQAERIERQAHLEGQARTYGQHPADTPTPTTEGDAPEPEFLPGSRRVPTR